ncbi:hypothetical protein MKX01_036826 [Papaver californicum]|nr:hypothetical protein MKX01_036826 [Papaver californicum]
MGKSEKENLTSVLHKHLEVMQETFYVLEAKPRSSLQKVDWQEVINMGEQLSKQATVAGLLWSGEAPEENIGIYFNMLQEFLLLAHRSKMGAGPSLSQYIDDSAKRFAHSNYSFYKEAVSSFGTHNEDRKLLIPQLADSVWEACASLKETPTTNYTATALVITGVAGDMEYVLCDLKALKPASSEDPKNENTPDGLVTDLNENDDDVDNGSSKGGELGNDLSPDMKMEASAIILFSYTLTAIKELVCFITGLGRFSKPANNDGKSVTSLEELLVRCQNIWSCINELGACLTRGFFIEAASICTNDNSSM